KDGGRAVGRRQRCSLRVLGRGPSRKGRERARAGIEVLVARAHVVELARGSVAAAVELSAHDDSCAEPGADRGEGEVVDASRDPLRVLGDRREVDVVLECYRKREDLGRLAAKVAPLEPGDVRGEGDSLVERLDDTWNADDDGVDALVREAARFDERRP